MRQQKFLGSAWPEELGKEWKELSLEFQAKVCLLCCCADTKPPQPPMLQLCIVTCMMPHTP